MLPRMTGSAETPGSLTQTSTPARSRPSHMMRNIVRLACTPAISSRNTRGVQRVDKDLRRLCDCAKLTIAGLHFRQANQFGPKRPVSKADLAERHTVHMSARRHDVR